MNDDINAKRLDRLQQIIELAPTGKIPDLRTKLDEWKAFRDRGGLLTRGGRQRWFNNPCPWKEAERLRAHMDWITPAAEWVLIQADARDPRVKKENQNDNLHHRLIVEHAMPIKVLHDMIVGNPALREIGALEAFLDANFKRGVLTAYEDGLLNDAGLRQRMPGDWDGADPFARYRHLGLTKYDHSRPPAENGVWPEDYPPTDYVLIPDPTFSEANNPPQKSALDSAHHGLLAVHFAEVAQANLQTAARQAELSGNLLALAKIGRINRYILLAVAACTMLAGIAYSMAQLVGQGLVR